MPSEREERLGVLREAYAVLPGFECKGLCAESCGPIGMTRMEADRIEERTGRPIGLVDLTGACPLLVDGKCSVYDVRPAVCRLWGSVQGMECPHGCLPTERLLTPAQGRAFMATVEYATGGRMQDVNTLPRHLLDQLRRNLRRIQQDQRK